MRLGVLGDHRISVTWQSETLTFFLVARGAPLCRGALCHGTFGTMVNPALVTDRQKDEHTTANSALA